MEIIVIIAILAAGHGVSAICCQIADTPEHYVSSLHKLHQSEDKIRSIQ
jgi:hypothetical protein